MSCCSILPWNGFCIVYQNQRRGADLFSRAECNPDVIADAMKNVCRLDVEPDGMLFDASSVMAVKIIEGAEYNGIRPIVRGGLGKARVSLQIDIGFTIIIIFLPDRQD